MTSAAQRLLYAGRLHFVIAFTWTLLFALTAGAADAAPATPVNITPAQGATGVSLTPTLVASAFSDADAADTHAASQWIVRQLSDNAELFNSGTDTTNKVNCPVPGASGLAYSTTYSWQVRYQDSQGVWSDYSTATTFTTEDQPPVAEWTRATLPGSVTAELWSVAYAAGRYVMVGKAGTILTSADGVTWVKRIPGIESDLRAVAYGAGTFVAVGANGTILTSADGVGWVRQNSNTTQTFCSIVFGANGFVAVGTYGTIRTSPTGTTWTTRSAGTPYTLNSVVYGNGLYVAVGEAGSLITSLDGITWTLRNSGVSTALRSVAFGNDTFVVVGSYTTVLSSSNGFTWTVRHTAAENEKGFYGVTFGDGLFVAAGDSGWIWDSVNGAIWNDRSVNTGYAFKGVGYGAGGFFSIGTNAEAWRYEVGAGSAAPPVITSTLNARVTAGETFSYQITAYNHPATFSASGLPAGLAVAPTTGLISGTPTEPGWFPVTLSATNAAGSGTAMLGIYVSAPGAVVPSNDNFAFATPITGIYATEDGSNVHATRENGEPVHTSHGGQSVWWKWTAPYDGLVVISTDGSSFDTILAVYSGDSLAALDLVERDDNGGKGTASLLRFEAVAGETYYIAVDRGQPDEQGNVRLTLSQSLASLKGTYSGVVGGDTVSPDSSGTFTFALTVNGKFTASVILGGIRYNLRGKLDHAGGFTGNAKSGKRVLQVSLNVQTRPDGSLSVNGSLLQNSTLLPLSGGRSITYTAKAPSPHRGKYTVSLFPATIPNPISITVGYGVLNVSPTGKLRFSGTLADGAKVSQGGIMVENQWPCFLRPYAKRGIVMGNITFRDVANNSDLDGSLDWIRPANAKGAFFPVGPDGHAEAVINVLGARYTYVPKTRVLNFPTGNGLLRLTGEFLDPAFNETGSIFRTIILNAANKVVPASDRNLKMKVNVKNGLFTGSFRDTNVGRSFGGVVLQKINVGVGMFKANDESGLVWLEAVN